MQQRRDVYSKPFVIEGHCFKCVCVETPFMVPLLEHELFACSAGEKDEVGAAIGKEGVEFLMKRLDSFPKILRGCLLLTNYRSSYRYPTLVTDFSWFDGFWCWGFHDLNQRQLWVDQPVLIVCRWARKRRSGNGGVLFF